MNKLLVTMTMIAFFAATFGLAIAVSSDAIGPAPNSGDGVSDGSGMDTQNGPNNSGSAVSGNEPSGPAPNSGDGIPDGSGMDSPNGPHSEGPVGSGKGNAPEGNGPNSHSRGENRR